MKLHIDTIVENLVNERCSIVDCRALDDDMDTLIDYYKSVSDSIDEYKMNFSEFIDTEYTHESVAAKYLSIMSGVDIKLITIDKKGNYYNILRNGK